MRDLTPDGVKTPEDAAALVDARSASHVHVGLTDMSGVLRGPCVSKEKFLAALDKGMPFNPRVHAAHFSDVGVPVPMGEVAKRDGDGRTRIIPESCREIPWEAPERNLFFLLEFADESAAFDPRNVYNRVEARAKEMGLRAFHSCELEFTLFKESLESLNAKGFHDPVPIRPTSAYYHTFHYSCSCDFFNGLIDSMGKMGIAAEKIHWEYSPGSAEVVLRYREGARAADDATIFKTFAKVFARQHELLMSFMARWSDEVPGNSGHVHVSLRDQDGNTVFGDPSDPLGISSTMRHFLGGLQRGIPELVLMLAPHFNSYKRFVPGIDTPLAAVWALDNRSVAFRVVGDTPSSLRVENRVGGSDVNPYLALACTLGAGLWGIESELEPTAPIVGDAQDQMDRIPEQLHLPQSFPESIERFRKSEIARELFGEEFVRVFTDTRVQQDLMFRRSVSDHERRFFLELE